MSSRSPLPIPHSPLARAFVVAILFVLGALQCAAADLAWPATTEVTKPWSRWWWLGNITTDDGLRSEMQKYAAVGLGGLEITPIYGVRGKEDQFITYLSPKWVERFEFVLREGKQLGLGIDMNNGTGWPFGGPWVTPDDTCKYLAHKTYTIKAGQRLSEPVEMKDKEMVRSASGARISISQIKEPFADTPNLQELAIDNLVLPKALPLNTLMAFSDQGGKPLNLTDKVASDGSLDWTAPADSGTWTLYALFTGLHSRMVKRAAPGDEGHAPDHFSAEAIQHYLAKFDEALAGKNLDGLRAFFCDSYEVDDGTRGEANFTPQFFEEFQKRRGYDLRDHLPALFAAPSSTSSASDETARVLCDYRETISDILLDNFMGVWRKWAAGHGKIVRDQAHGSPGNVLDLYAAADIPETEGFGNPGNASSELNELVAMMYASSAAHVTGKRLASSETCTWLDDHFLTTLAHAQQRINTTLLAGINHIFYHGTPYSPPDQAWPGFLFYAAVEFCPANSWWDDFAALNKYVERCQSFLQAGQPDNDLLVYAPFYDRWMEPGNGTMPHFKIGGPFPAQDVGRQLFKAGYTFDFISDRLLQDVTYSDARLHSGGNSYEAIYLPETKYIPLATMEKILDLVKQGATLITPSDLPSDVPGWGNLDERRAKLKQLLSTVSKGSFLESLMWRASYGKGTILQTKGIARLPYISAAEKLLPGLECVRRRDGDKRIYFIVNGGEKPIDGWVPLVVDFPAAAAIFDPMSGQFGRAAVGKSDYGHLQVYLQLAVGQSCIVVTSPKDQAGPQWTYYKPHGDAKPLAGTWNVSFIKGGPKMPAEVQIDKLQSWTEFAGEEGKAFSGTAKYTLKFADPETTVDAWRLDLGKVAESARVSLNGEELGVLIAPPYTIDIPSKKIHFQNVIEISVSNLMANRIADMDKHSMPWKIFYNVNVAAHDRVNAGPNNVFSAAKWSPRPSGLLGPVTLQPLQKFTPPEKK